MLVFVNCLMLLDREHMAIGGTKHHQLSQASSICHSLL